MSKNINQANSKLNTSNKKLKQAYSKSDSKNLKVIYMPHWLEFYSIAIHSDVTSNKKRYYKSYSRGTVVYVKLGSNIGSEFSGNHFCVILDNKDNKGKDTYVNISAITTISKRRISKINDSDPTGTIIISEDDMNEIEKQLKIKFFSN
ncbi:TPA: type II toxin-antitoxin system PemK/MazF family toxin [Staphylococcus aureus]|nr:type II toxin-antitoxin system PemK/MazF family toxin [Staphylococcus aureus]